MDNFTALVIPLDESVEPIQSFRLKHVHKPAVEVPPHISIFYPFLSVSEVDAEVEKKLTEIVTKHFPFEFCLVGFGFFESAEVVYLKPESETLFLSLFHYEA